jgi:hypothetical protein
MYRRDAEKISEELRRIAALVERLIGVGETGTRSYGVLTQIGNRLERVGNTLEKGIAAGRLTSAQIRSIGSGFEAIGAALRRGSPPRRTTTKRRTTTTRRTTTKRRTTTRKGPARRRS